MFVEKSCVWISILFERVDNTKSQAPPKKKNGANGTDGYGLW